MEAVEMDESGSEERCQDTLYLIERLCWEGEVAYKKHECTFPGGVCVGVGWGVWLDTQVEASASTSYFPPDNVKDLEVTKNNIIGSLWSEGCWRTEFLSFMPSSVMLLTASHSIARVSDLASACYCQLPITYIQKGHPACLCMYMCMCVIPENFYCLWLNVIISDILQRQNAFVTQMWLWASFFLLMA